MNLKYQKKISNYNLIEEQKRNGVSVVKGYPYWLTIDPSSICNLKCVFCPTGQERNTRPRAVMPFAKFKKIIDTLGPYLFHIDFCNWGEPFINKDIVKMIIYAKKYGPTIKVDSNLNVDLSDKDIESLIASGLDRITVSVDGASQKTYQIYRRNGNFDKAIENMKRLCAKKKQMNSAAPHIHWQFLVFKHNEHEINAARQMSKEIGVDSIGFTAPFCSPDWAPANEEFNRYIVKNNKVEFKPVKQLCNWLWDAITINADGSVSACCSVEDAKDDFGNFFSQPFNELWNNGQFQAARKHVAGKTKSDINNICTKCGHIGVSNHAEIRLEK